MKLLVIVNPLAGKKALRLFPQIKRWLLENPHEFSFRIPTSQDEMRFAITKAPSLGIQGILLCGGDGTVHEALPAIAEANLPFALIPCGRGNDFARNIGLSVNLGKKRILPFDPMCHQFDLPTVNAIPFVSIACIGLDADVNKLARDGKGYFDGKLGYIICVLKALKNFYPFEIEMTIDGQLWRDKVMMVTIANGPYYGGGMKIAPDAMMDDGVLNICIVKNMPKWELLREFPKVFKGTHISNPNFIMKTGQKVKIQSDEHREIFADGEYVGSLPAECTIGNQTIQIMSFD